MMIIEEAFNEIVKVLDNEPKDKESLIGRYYMIEGIIKNANKELLDIKEEVDSWKKCKCKLNNGEVCDCKNCLICSEDTSLGNKTVSFLDALAGCNNVVDVENGKEIKCGDFMTDKSDSDKIFCNSCHKVVSNGFVKLGGAD